MKKEDVVAVLEQYNIGDVIDENLHQSIVFVIDFIKKLNLYNRSAEKIGECFTNERGEIAKIVEYNDANHITIEFQDEKKARITTCYSSVQKGMFKNPYGKLIFNIGCIGYANSRGADGKKKKSYTTWFAMMQRCYKECYSNKPTYIDCSVCDEWLCFENFEKWYDENYYEVPGEIMNLDKDILSSESKMYSPDTCVFVPQCINKYFVKRQPSKDGLPIGVYKNKSGTYGTRFLDTIEHSNKRLGTFETVEEAAEAYRKRKEENIHALAVMYKDYLPEFLFEILVNYKLKGEI